MSANIAKSKFIGELDARKLISEDEETWELLSNFSYESVLAQKCITAVKGFVTDFESVPRVMPLIYAMVKGKYSRSGVIHDWGYQTHWSSKEVIDNVFLESMKVEDDLKKVTIPDKGFLKIFHGIRAFWNYSRRASRRRMVYWGVKLGGQSSYNSGPQRRQIKKIEPNDAS